MKADFFSRFWFDENQVLCRRTNHVDKTPPIFYLLASLTYLTAALTSNYALEFVSYPMQVLGKSMKPLPVMIFGTFLARKKYPLVKYLYVLTIIFGTTICTWLVIFLQKEPYVFYVSRRYSFHISTTRWRKRKEKSIRRTGRFRRAHSGKIDVRFECSRVFLFCLFSSWFHWFVMVSQAEFKIKFEIEVTPTLTKWCSRSIFGRVCGHLSEVYRRVKFFNLFNSSPSIRSFSNKFFS